MSTLDGTPYVFYTQNINKVWFYLGLMWIYSWQTLKNEKCFKFYILFKPR